MAYLELNFIVVLFDYKVFKELIKKTFILTGVPRVNILHNLSSFIKTGTIMKAKCEVLAYPPAQISWKFLKCSSPQSCSETVFEKVRYELYSIND